MAATAETRAPRHTDPAEEARNLPSGEYDIPLMIQDRTLRSDNSLFYEVNPETIEYITTLSKNVSEKLGGILLIGDVAQRTGGPMYDEHSSHQTGLC